MHLFPKKYANHEDEYWGYNLWRYDGGPLRSFGVGPFVSFHWSAWRSWFDDSWFDKGSRSNDCKCLCGKDDA